MTLYSAGSVCYRNGMFVDFVTLSLALFMFKIYCLVFFPLVSVYIFLIALVKKGLMDFALKLCHFSILSKTDY